MTKKISDYVLLLLGLTLYMMGVSKLKHILTFPIRHIMTSDEVKGNLFSMMDIICSIKGSLYFTFKVCSSCALLLEYALALR